MIPVAQIIAANLYSQDDAEFLLGEGFSEKAAREVICEARRSGQLPSTQWRRRFWFTGASFLAWVGRWFGLPVGEIEEEVASVGGSRYGRRTDPEPVAGKERRSVE